MVVMEMVVMEIRLPGRFSDVLRFGNGDVIAMKPGSAEKPWLSVIRLLGERSKDAFFASSNP